MLRPLTSRSSCARSSFGAHLSHKPSQSFPRPGLRSQITSAVQQAELGTAKVIKRNFLQGSRDWDNYLPDGNPKLEKSTPPRAIKLHSPDLVPTLIKYGEFTQVCYDSFNGDIKDDPLPPCEPIFGKNKYPPEALLQEALLDKASPLLSYTDVKYLYAESGGNTYAEIWAQRPLKRYWMGYAAVGPKEKSTGLRDVVFAWRGTIARSEWRVDAESALVEHEKGSNALVAEGFSTMYMVATQKRLTPKAQVHAIMKGIWKKYGDEIGSITVCGHSLGGALAHLCAFDLGFSELNINKERPGGHKVPITAYTYCSPRVGDEEFKKAMDAMDIKVLRTVNFRDVVPKVPGISAAEFAGKDIPEDGGEYLGFGKGILDKAGKGLYRMAMKLPWKKQYADVGTELILDSLDYNDIIKTGGRAKGAAGRVHNLEVLLHLIDPERDIALMNKSEDAVISSVLEKKGEGSIPVAWHVAANKGLHPGKDADGRTIWRRAYRPYQEEENEPDAAASGVGTAAASANGSTSKEPAGLAPTAH